jgi:hypothetical protein
MVVDRRSGDIELDHHVDGSCLISLDEDRARALSETLLEWPR